MGLGRRKEPAEFLTFAAGAAAGATSARFRLFFLRLRAVQFYVLSLALLVLSVFSFSRQFNSVYRRFYSRRYEKE